MKIEYTKPLGQIRHIYDPESGKELKTFLINPAPYLSMWSQDCKSFFYTQGNNFFGLDWNAKSEAQEIFKFPDSVVPYQAGQKGVDDPNQGKLHNIWRQKKGGTWRLSAITDDPKEYVLTVFELQKDKSWKQIAKKKTKGCFSDSDGCDMNEFKKDVWDPDPNLVSAPSTLGVSHLTAKIDGLLIKKIMDQAKKEKKDPESIKNRVQFDMGDGVFLELGLSLMYGDSGEPSADFSKPVKWSKAGNILELLKTENGQVVFNRTGDWLLLNDVGQGSYFLYQVKTGFQALDLNRGRGPVEWVCPLK